MIQQPSRQLASTSSRAMPAVILAAFLLVAVGQAGYRTLQAAPLNPPPLPATFYGTVSIAGSSAPADATVTAWINGQQVATTFTFLDNGLAIYQINVPGDDPDTARVEGGQAGDLIQFQIDGQAASPTALWQLGVLAPLDLAVTAPTETPTPEETPTVVPTETPTPEETPTVAPTETPAPGELLIRLAADPSSGSHVRVGHLITYTLTVSQTGSDPLTNVVISATLPAAASYLANSAQPAASYVPAVSATATAASGGTLVWHLAALASDQSFQGQFTVHIVAAGGSPFALQVTARSDQSGPSQQTIFHPLDPTAVPETTEPLRYRLSLPILLR